MSKEIEVVQNNEFHRGSSEQMERDFSHIAGHYFYLAEDLPERKETSEREPSYHEKGHDKRLIETTYKARRAVKGDVTLLALRLHFTDDILHSIEMAAHPADPDQSTLRFLVDEFYTLFKPVDGEPIRAAEIEKVNERIREIQQSLIAPPPPSSQTLLPASQYKRPSTTDLVRAAGHKEEMVARANAVAVQAEERMKFLQDGQKEIEQQSRVLVNFYQEKASAAIATVGDQIAFAKDLTEGLTSLSLYTGDKVNVHKIVEGQSADPSIPLHLYQDRLYFDEELAAEGIIGGFDFGDVSKLDQIFSRNFRVIDRMIPAERGCVLVRVRREDKNYGGNGENAIAEALMNLENQTTYLLVRDGENVYIVYSEITTDQAHHLFPSMSDIDRIFRFSGREIRPEHLDYSKARDMFERNTVFYKRMLLLLWGLSDRENLFGDFYNKDVHGNWYSEEFQSKHLVYVYDAEGTLTVQRPSFSDWVKEQNSKIQIGSRLAVNWPALINISSAPDCYSNRPDHNNKYYRQFPSVDAFGVVLVDKNNKDRLVVRTQAHGWGRSPNKKVEKTVSVDVELGLYEDSIACVCLDDIEIEDLNYYLESRKERQSYLSYFELFKMIRAQITAEDEEQGATRAKLLNDLLHGVVDEVKAKASLKTAVRLWRAQNGGRMLGDKRWTKDDHETVLNIAFALSGAQNDLMDRLKKTHPDLSVIEIRIDGKGQFWVYSEPTEADRCEASAKIAVVHVNRERLKVSKRNVSVATPRSRVYLRNPLFNVDDRSDKRRNAYFNPVREETVIGDASLIAKWADLKLPEAPTIEDLSAMARLAQIDAKDALEKLDLDAVAQQVWEEVNKRNKEKMVPTVSMVQPLAVVNVKIEQKEAYYVLALSANALNALYLEGERGKQLSTWIVNNIYGSPEGRLKRLQEVESRGRSAYDFTLVKMDSAKAVLKTLPVIASKDFTSIDVRMKNYNIMSSSHGASYETLEEAVFKALNGYLDEQRSQIEYLWFNEANQAFAKEHFEAIKDKPDLMYMN